MTRVPELRRFETLPDSVKPFDEKERKQFELLCHSMAHLAETPANIGASLEKALKSTYVGQIQSEIRESKLFTWLIDHAKIKEA